MYKFDENYYPFLNPYFAYFLDYPIYVYSYLVHKKFAYILFIYAPCLGRGDI